MCSIANIFDKQMSFVLRVPNEQSSYLKSSRFFLTVSFTSISDHISSSVCAAILSFVSFNSFQDIVPCIVVFLLYILIWHHVH